METKTIKISGDNYHWLVGIAGELQREEGKPVSIDSALTSLRKPQKKTLLDLGDWKDDKEMQKIFDDIVKQRRQYKGRRIATW